VAVTARRNRAPIRGLFSFEARYNAGETRFYTPASIADDAQPAAADAAYRCTPPWDFATCLGSTSFSTATGTPWFLEASVMPGLTETSLFPQALEVAGHDVGWVYLALCQAALREAR
jgi:D-alanine-D-alanine ligase